MAKAKSGSAAAVAGLACILGWAAPLLAATPVPPYPADHVAVADVTDNYAALRTFLADFESQVGATYDVAVVAFTDRQNRRGPEYGDVDDAYIDSVMEAWIPHVNANTCVIIVLSLENRDIIVSPCARWAALGFESDEVVAVIEGSSFGLNARAGNYTRALTELVRAVDRNLAQRVADRAAGLRQAAQELEDTRLALAQVTEELSARPPVAEVQEHLALVPAELEAAVRALEQEHLTDVHDRLRRARQHLELAENAQRAEENAALRESMMTWAGVGVGVLVILALLLLRLWRVRHERRAAQREIASWDTLLARAGERLLALENEHALLLGRRDLVDHFKGETADPILAVARRVDELFMSFERAQQVLGEARALASRGGFLAMGPLKRAADQLTNAEIVARTEDVKERRLFLPHQREVRMPAHALLAHLETSYEAALQEVETLEGRITDSWDALDKLVERARQAEACHAELVELGLDPKTYVELLRPLAERVQALRDRGATDPLGVAAETTVVATDLDGLVARCDRAVEAVGWLARQVRPERERLRAEVARLRSEEGLALGEPGFEPDAMLERAHTLEERGLREVQQGNDERGHEIAAEAVDIVEDVPELLTASQASRRDSPGRLGEAEGRSATLRLQLTDRRERIGALRKIHADEALQPALDNAEEAHAALDFADRCVADGESAVAATEQRYLAGAELIRRAFDALDQVDALYAEIEQKASQLDVLRQTTERDVKEAEGLLEDIRGGLDGDPPFASTTVLGGRDELQKLLAEVQSAAKAERPNWVAAQRGAETLQGLARSTRDRMQRDRDAHAQAAALRPELDALRTGIDAILRSSTEDRAPANDRFQQATALLAELEPHLKAERPDWIEVLPLLTHAQALLNESKSLAEADFSAAAAARQAISQAEASLRQADRSYGHGVRPELDASRSMLHEAQQKLGLEEYEAAAERAGQSRLKAVEAERAAVASAARAEAQVQEMARRHWYDGSSSRGSSFSFGSSSRSSSRSFGSSSGRSSFSSGRSSFGSSSGRSSVGRSSGRSKF